MNPYKKIERLENENKALREENKSLKNELEEYYTSSERISVLQEELNEMKVKWDTALKKLEKQRLKYKELNYEMKAFRNSFIKAMPVQIKK